MLIDQRRVTHMQHGLWIDLLHRGLLISGHEFLMHLIHLKLVFVQEIIKDNKYQNERILVKTLKLA